MMRLGLVLVAVVLGCAPGGLPRFDDAALERTPAGRAFRSWLAAYNTGRADSLEAALTRLYSESALVRRPAAERAAGLLDWFRNYGAMTPVRLDSLTQIAAVVTVREELTGGWGVVYLDVDSVPPYPVTGVGLLPFTEPPDFRELTVADDSALAAQVRTLADRLARAGAFSGVVLLTHGSRTLVREAYGGSGGETPTLNTPETRFELASVSKMFTAVAALQQVEAGRLALDSTIGSVLPELPAPASGATLHQLLTMSSGIPDFFRSPRYWAERSRIRTFPDYWPYFAGRPLEFPSGTGWSYSNSNFLLLGAAVERVAGRPFAEVVTERVFRVADMTNTAYDGGGPAGGGVSTVADLERFARELLAGRLIGPGLLARALTGHVATEYGGRDGYGFETRNWNGVRIVGHGGAFTGISHQVDMYPDLGYVLVVLGNSDRSGAQAIASRVRGMIAASPRLAAAGIR